MTSYIGRHAKLYDLFYADKPYSDEVNFIHSILKRYSIFPVNRILELACGTGTHAIFLSKIGYDVIGTDYSQDMLKYARLKAEKDHQNLEFQLMDMRTLPKYQPPFDAVICLFDSIGYVATNKGIIDVMNGVHRNLKENGLFIFEFWHAGAMLRKYDPIRVRQWNTNDCKILRISHTTLDCANQCAMVEYQVYELNNNGTYTYFTEQQTNRYFLLQEMEILLDYCHFKPLRWYSGFSDVENITEDTWHIIAVAQRVK